LPRKLLRLELLLQGLERAAGLADLGGGRPQRGVQRVDGFLLLFELVLEQG
jgi:hypothetical protein